ncbi:hypothetical protein ACO9S2_11950 [Nitrospira sp. NS4]|uniref:hypothetical protein n=1 Tax=Nitrospira sp. NS4 TaxID=3414498 RepID=UPI003C2D9E35
MESRQSRLGLFVSYNEKKNGKFQEAVDVCDDHGYVIWLENSVVRKERFVLPTTILIKITGEDRYYRGELREIKRAEEFDRNALLAEASHRPAKWRQGDKGDYAGFKSVLYIADLKQVPRPAGIDKGRGPRRPIYTEESILRG